MREPAEISSPINSAGATQAGVLTTSVRAIPPTRRPCRLTDAAGAPLYVVGGFSSLRPAPGADRFVADLSHAPAEYHDELLAVAALVTDDLPATPETLDRVLVSPAARFGAHVPGAHVNLGY